MRSLTNPRLGPTPELAIRRVIVLGSLMIVSIMIGLGALLGRVVQLQVRPTPRIASLVDSQKGRRTLDARRGSLFDRHGHLLASSRVANELFVDPLLVQDPNTFSEDLAYALDYDPVWVERQISRRWERRWVLIDRRLSDERLARLKQLNLPGAGTQTWLVRDYPKGYCAGQVIGFVGRDGHGLNGLEWALNRQLSGVNGWLHYVRDARQRPLWIPADGYQPPVNGQPVRLTIDLTIQAIAEKTLAQTCRDYRAAAGQIVVMDARNGHILAMANYPFFNPNDPARTQLSSWRNRCVTDAFEPGSIFKPFIWSMATQTRTARPDESIPCTTSGFYVSPRGRRLRDTRGHGRITWRQILIKSSNIGMAIVGQRMGATAMYQAVRRFGFGNPTYSGLPGESRGIVNPVQKWNHYSVTSVPMGQEIAATPIQLVRAFSVFANDGLIPKPRIRLSTADRAARPIYQRVLSENTARRTRQVLRRVVTEGTGQRAESRQYAIFGKTGTAQIPDPTGGGYLEDQFVASFIGGAPVEDPCLVVGCFIHRPDRSKGYYGGTVAAPAVRQVIEQTLPYLGVPPRWPKRAKPVQLVHH